MLKLPRARLLSGSALRRFLDDLEVSLHNACVALTAENPAITQSELVTKLRTTFNAMPTDLLIIDSLTVQPSKTLYEVDGAEAAGHLAYASVVYSGSKLMLRTSPAPDFKF